MYKKKVTFTANDNDQGPTTKQVYMPKGNYQRIIESKTSSSYSQNAIESGGIPNENEMRDEMLDDVDLDLDNRTALNEFDKMSAGQKLFAIAQRTQELKIQIQSDLSYNRIFIVNYFKELKSKAEEFDAKMKKLNDQYHFLDKDIQKQTSKLESSAATYTNKNRKY